MTVMEKTMDLVLKEPGCLQPFLGNSLPGLQYYGPRVTMSRPGLAIDVFLDHFWEHYRNLSKKKLCYRLRYNVIKFGMLLY